MTRRNFLFTILGIGAIAKAVKRDINYKEGIKFYRNGKHVPYNKLFRGEFETPVMGDYRVWLKMNELVFEVWDGTRWGRQTFPIK